MQDQLMQALKVQDVEYADIRIEDKTNSWVNFRGQDLDTIGSARTVGGIVRALYKGGWGYATFNDLGDLETRVREACQTARLVGTEKTYWAPVEPVVEVIKARLVKDFRTIPLADKKALMEEYNQIILGYHKSIQTSTVRYADTFKTVWYANTEGMYIEEEKPDVNILTAAVARKDDIVQTGFETGGAVDGYQGVEAFHDKAKEAAKKAVELLAAPRSKAASILSSPTRC
ncbi:MAG: DNA gyrase modulator [Chloroflexota bacterium]